MERKKNEITDEQISRESTLFLLFMLKFYVPGQHYLGHFEDVASNLVGLLPNIEMK